MVRVCFAWAQLYAGIGINILESTSLPLDYVPARWLLSLRQFLHSIDATILIYQLPIYPLQRQNDGYIMDIVHSFQLFSTYEIRMINRVRLYLQITTVSDIATTDSQSLQLSTRLGKPNHLSSLSKWLYPIQPCPSHPSWSLWLKVVDRLIAPQGSFSAPLGRWTGPAASLSRNWNSYHHLDGNYHFIRQCYNSKL